jgi:hypothetical protein
MSAFSSRAVRLAIHDGMLQEEQRTHARLAERLRAENAEMFRIQRGMANLAKELLIVQRRMAAIADLIALDEQDRMAA